MLQTLHIKNYALIEDLTLSFGPGLIIGTGETGAGKSIIIDAIGLILGDRASAQAVRAGAPRCIVTAAFDIAGLPQVKAALSEAGFEPAPGEPLILRREVDAAGKSRAFINDAPASAGTLSSIGAHLIDVHGQHEHQRLFDPAAQRELLDGFARAGTLAGEVHAAYEQWKRLTEQKNARTVSAEEKQRLMDMYAFQVKEIDDARLEPGEEETIARALPQLKNAEKLGELAAQALQLLGGEDGAARDRLGAARKLLSSAETLGGEVASACSLLDSAYDHLDESIRDIERFAGALSTDPERLNQLLERQALIHKLTKKYGTDTTAMLAYRDARAAELAALSNDEQSAAELDRAIATALKQLVALCDRLTAARQAAGDKLAAGVTKELAGLGMKKARFSVQCGRRDEPGPDGRDDIEFLFSANVGETTGPLRELASGGELSRVMLAVKAVLARADRVPVLVFDEIDAGIGGPTGQAVGKKLAELARHHQVLCITHLPQIAAFAQEHWSVAKKTEAGRTTTAVTTLDAPARVAEIARMLSGRDVTPAAQRHAAELIQAAHQPA